MIKKYNAVKGEKYFTKDGQEKTAWKNVGDITFFIKEDGSESGILEIPAIGLKASIFPFKEKEPVKTAQQIENERPNEPVIDPSDGRILDLNEIPF